MPKFDLSWRSEGTAEVEADNLEEAVAIVQDCLDRWDAFDLDNYEVEKIDIWGGGEV